MKPKQRSRTTLPHVLSLVLLAVCLSFPKVAADGSGPPPEPSEESIKVLRPIAKDSERRKDFDCSKLSTDFSYGYHDENPIRLIAKAGENPSEVAGRFIARMRDRYGNPLGYSLHAKLDNGLLRYLVPVLSAEAVFLYFKVEKVDEKQSPGNQPNQPLAPVGFFLR